MKRTVSLWIRSNGKYSKALYTDQRQTRLKPQDGQYYLRFAGGWEAVGSDPLLALDAKASKEKLLRDAERGTATTDDSLALRIHSTSRRRRLDTSIKSYLTTGKAAEKDWRKHTVQCYTLTLALFKKSCFKKFLDEINGDDLRSFKVFLRGQETSAGKKIEPRTVYNHFNNVVSFLNAYGCKNLIAQNEWPTYEEKEVVSYEPEVVQWLFEFADVEENDVLEFFLGVGFRNGEGTHVEWPDIDFRNKEVHIYSKRQKFDWRMKDNQQRIIGISDSLTERLAARWRRHPGNGLVFANSRGNPDKHLLRIIKRVALRAGLNCGRCIGTFQRKRVPCATHPVCQKWIIHTLRKTWATFQARIGTAMATIRHDLGHSSLITTQKYLASDERRSKRRREQINAAAALVKTSTAPRPWLPPTPSEDISLRGSKG